MIFLVMGEGCVQEEFNKEMHAEQALTLVLRRLVGL